MKKLTILIAAVVLMATTACNEKPAKTDNADTPDKVQVDTAKKVAQPKVNVEKAAPTEDGKDHVVAEFETSEHQMRLENLADGTYRLSMWKKGQDKSGQPAQVVESKKCVLQGGNYLMRADDGKVYVIDSNKGQVVLMDKKNLTKL
jgi:hypothetical protein